VIPFVLSCASDIYNPGPMAEPPIDVLLPKTVSPVKYTLTLKPDLETFRFAGVAQIELDVKEDTQELKFHAAELEFLKVIKVN
jgi:hypothetical protein